MSFRRFVARKLIEITHAWHSEIHIAINDRVMTTYFKAFPYREGDNSEDVDKRINDMRTFYYERMSVTANLLIACAALFIALAALLVTVIQLFH